MKIAVVVQRYGQAINGGAELHARYVAEHLARHGDVEVLTTCATDYVTWRNELEAGVEKVNGVPVRRFPVKHERDPDLFGRRSSRVFEQTHSLGDELDWLDAEGPTSPALVDYVATHAADYDYCLFFSYRYYHAYHGARAAGARAILVPTAERDAAVGLAIFRPLFRSVRALMYNSPEERAMIHAVSGNQDVPGLVVGIGSAVPQNVQPERFRQKFNVRGPFAVYVGRIDQNKGCSELFEFFQGYLENPSHMLSLVLVGNSLLDIPKHPRIRHLGFLDDSDKFDAMAAADVLIMPSYFESYLQDPQGKLSLVLIGNSLLPIPQHPRIRHLGFLNDTDKFDAMAAAELLFTPSYYESLSMVALEAWALGRPVLANGKCDVLKGQCIRSNAGLYYETFAEFIETLWSIEHNRWLNSALGRNGRQFYREHYDWPVIERKYLDTFERLKKEPPSRPSDPLPGWFDRRRQDVPAAEEVVARLPTGPALTPPTGTARTRPGTLPAHADHARRRA